ncbi:MAG: DUF1795 domain-containing protein [Myxococcaceae bacterium]|nr:DUF1795 domain-containing protein [Myxococcaceae bacterium]
MKYGNLQMSLPEGWSDATQIVAQGPVEEGFRSSLTYVAEPLKAGETPPQYAARMLGVLKGAEQFQLVSEKPANFGKVKGFLRESTHQAKGMKLAQLHFYVLQDGQVHTFTFTQRAERLQATRQVAERLFASVSLGGGSTMAGGPGLAGMRPKPKYIEPRHLRIIAA